MRRHQRLQNKQRPCTIKEESRSGRIELDLGDPLARSAPAQKRSRLQVEPSTETRSQLAGERARQAQLAQARQRTEQAQRQAAADPIAALRLRLNQEATGGDSASGTASHLQRIRLETYQILLRDQIIAAWILPVPLTETRDLHARVLLRVGRTGEVTQLQLLQSSGHSIFDASFLRAIRLASPLPTLPSDFEGEFLDIELRFSSPDP